MGIVKLVSFSNEHIKSVLFEHAADHGSIAHVQGYRDRLDEAIEAQKKFNLRYHNNNGKMYGEFGLNEWPSVPSEHIPHETEDQVIEWEFSREIWNSASRLTRGFSA